MGGGGGASDGRLYVVVELGGMRERGVTNDSIFLLMMTAPWGGGAHQMGAYTLWLSWGG